MNLFEEIVKESLTENRDLIIEGREGSQLKAARNLTKAAGYKDPMKLSETLREMIESVRELDCFFIYGVTRLALAGELGEIYEEEQNNEDGTKSYNYTIENGDGVKINRLNRLIAILCAGQMEALDAQNGKAYLEKQINGYDCNLNGDDLNTLLLHNATAIDEFIAQETHHSEGRNFEEQSDYQIVRIPDYETAHKYGHYTAPQGDGGMQWCITASENAWNSYTHNNTGIFYFCFKNGFKDIPREKTEGYIKDAYGLSLIAVSVDENGAPNTITPRWNHGMPTDFTLTDAVGRNNSMFTVEELENILKVDFYATFVPRKPKVSIPDALANGTPLNEIFDTIKPIEGTTNAIVTAMINGKERYAILNTESRQFVTEWLNSISEPDENGLMIAQLTHFENGAYILLKANGDKATDMTFNSITYIGERCYSVTNSANKKNICILEGNELHLTLREWVSRIVKMPLPFDGERFILVNDLQGRMKSNIVDKQTGDYTLSNWVDLIKISPKLTQYNLAAEYMFQGTNKFYKFIDVATARELPTFDWQDTNIITRKFNMGILPVKTEDGKYNFFSLRSRRFISNRNFDAVISGFNIQTQTAQVGIGNTVYEIDKDGRLINQQQGAAPQVQAAPQPPIRRGKPNPFRH